LTAKTNTVNSCLTVKRDKYFVVITYYEDGKRKSKWINTQLSASGNNKRKAQQKEKELLAEWEERLSLNNSQMLFSDFLKSWLERTKSSIELSTYYEYRKNIHNMICPYFDERRITLYELKPYHIQEFYSYKMETDKVKATTILHYHANIRKALEYAVKMEHISRNPARSVELPKKERHIANYYSAEELKVLMAKAKGTQIEVVVVLAAMFGLRRGEIIGMRWSSIDFENKMLTINGTVKDKGESGSKIQNMYYEPTAKTSSSIRSFPMAEDIVLYLQDLKKQQDQRKQSEGYNHQWDDFVCVRENGDLIPLEYVTRAFPKLCVDCGLRRLKLHELRHTNISLLILMGSHMKEVQEWAGHSSYGTTANTYAHVSIQSKTKLMHSISSVLT